jgi:hypothetical protein
MGSRASIGVKFDDELALLCDLPLSISRFGPQFPPNVVEGQSGP